MRDFLVHQKADFAAAAERVLRKNRDLCRRLARPGFLTTGEVLELHRRLVGEYGGKASIRDIGVLRDHLVTIHG